MEKDVNNNQDKNNSSQGLSIAGFILSFFMPLVGLILSIIGLVKCKKAGAGIGFGIAGIVISSIRIILTLLIVVFGGIFAFNFIKSNSGTVIDAVKCSSSYDCVLNEDGKYSCKYDSIFDEKVETITCSKREIDEFNILKDNSLEENSDLVSCKNYTNDGKCVYFKEGNIEIEAENLEYGSAGNFYINNNLIDIKYIDSENIKVIENDYVLLNFGVSSSAYELYDKNGKKPIDFSSVNSVGYPWYAEYDNKVLTIRSALVLDNISDNELCKYKPLDTIVDIKQEIKFINGKFSKPDTIESRTLKEVAKNDFNVNC